MACEPASSAQTSLCNYCLDVDPAEASRKPCSEAPFNAQTQCAADEPTSSEPMQSLAPSEFASVRNRETSATRTPPHPPSAAERVADVVFGVIATGTMGWVGSPMCLALPLPGAIVCTTAFAAAGAYMGKIDRYQAFGQPVNQKDALISAAATGVWAGALGSIFGSAAASEAPIARSVAERLTTGGSVVADVAVNLMVSPKLASPGL